MRRRRFSCETLSAPNSCCAWNFQVRPTTYPISPVSTLDTLAWPARFSTCSGDSRGQRSAGTATSRFPMLRRVENTVDGKTNVQILGRAAHLKLDQLSTKSARRNGSKSGRDTPWYSDQACVTGAVVLLSVTSLSSPSTFTWTQTMSQTSVRRHLDVQCS